MADTSTPFLIPITPAPIRSGIRPRFAPGITGKGSRIDSYVCPSDKSDGVPLTGSSEDPVDVTFNPSWQVNGNSYNINWYWQESPPWGGSNYGQISTDQPGMTLAGSSMLQRKVGGNAARFIIFMEASMNQFMLEARPQGWPTQSIHQQLFPGWHRKIAKYSAGFFDGHAEYSFFDTRFADGPTHTTWPEPNTPRGW